MKILALAALLVATTAHGQTVEQVNSALLTMRVQTVQLGAASNNLRDMMGGGTDRDFVFIVLNNASLYIAYIGQVSDLAALLSEMREPQDAQRVSIHLATAVNIILQNSDSIIASTNLTMTSIRGPAALAEATKVRDAMVTIKEQLRTIQATFPAPPSR